MHRSLPILVFCLHLVSVCSACPTECSCIEQVANCSLLTSFPGEDSFPADTREFLFDLCDFGIIEKISYTSATKLLILKSNVKNISADAFSDLDHLSHLDLTGNPLGELHANAFTGMEALKELVLVNTQLKYFPAGIVPTMPQLEKLDLSGNLHIMFDSDAFSTTSLKRLSLNNCSLTEAPPVPGSDVNSVVQLDLNHNDMGLLGDGSFWKYEGLHRLYLDNSGVETIHSMAFEGLADLQELYLGINSLTTLPEDVFERTEKLKILDLRKNKLATLEHKVVEGLEHLEEIDLSENPLKCDCSMVWVADVKLRSPEATLCAEPDELSGQSVTNATAALNCPEDFDEKSNYIALAVGIPIIIICVCLMGFFIFKIVQTRRARHSEKNVRYSAVYRDTTESADKTRPTSEL